MENAVNAEITIRLEGEVLMAIDSVAQNAGLSSRRAAIEKILQRWYEAARLQQESDSEIGDNLPETATLDEAVALYLADQCSLGRAAELANVTRWDIIDILKKRNIPIVIDANFSVAEMDAIAEELKREGLLC
jgi:predicted HTH domain antitoxin